VRLLDLNEVVQGVLERFDGGETLPGRCRSRLDAQLPAVLGDPEMLWGAVVDLVHHADRSARRRGGVLVVETERVASVVRGEAIARLRIGVRGTGVLSLAPAAADPDLARAAWVAAGHGGALAHGGGALAATTLDLPGIAVERPAAGPPEVSPTA
jgi:hypothetical protein